MAATLRVPHETPMYEDPPHNTRMSRTWIIFFQKRHGAAAAVEADPDLKATFGLVRELTIADSLTLHYIVVKPGRFVGVLANGKQPCTGSPARIVIEKWHDDGDDETPGAWVNIFADIGEEPGYIELADADTLELEPGAPYLEIFSPYVTPVATHFKSGDDGAVVAGDLLRINCTQIGATFAGKGYEIVLRWEP
jgi:hypothetical protein